MDLNTLSVCPVCGSTQLILDSEPHEGRAGFNLAFGLFGCEDCGTVYSLDDDRSACPNCGSVHDLPDRHVDKRVTGFGSDLVRLQERLEFAQNAAFSDRGERRTESEYATWLQSTVLEQLSGWPDDFVAAMSRGNFNDPEWTQTQAAWTDLQRLANEAVDFVLALKREPAPVRLIATHRTLVRGTLLLASAFVGFLTPLTAPTISVAYTRMSQAQEMLDRSATMIARACALAAGTDDPDDLPASGSAASAVFPELARVAASDPVLLRPLLPFCALARQGHDPDRRSERVESVASILSAAQTAAPGWTVPPDALLSRCSSAWRKLVAQHDRLIRVVDDDRERAGWVDDVLDIASKITEGPYRLYGGLVLIAARIAAGTESIFSAEVSDRYRAFTLILRDLHGVEPSLTEGVDELLRHTEAHYDYVVEHGRIKVHHLPPRGSTTPRIDELQFDDVIAAVLNLLELSLAMAAGVLRWAWEQGSIELREGLRQDWLSA